MFSHAKGTCTMLMCHASMVGGVRKSMDIAAAPCAGRAWYFSGVDIHQGGVWRMGSAVWYAFVVWYAVWCGMRCGMQHVMRMIVMLSKKMLSKKRTLKQPGKSLS